MDAGKNIEFIEEKKFRFKYKTLGFCIKVYQDFCFPMAAQPGLKQQVGETDIAMESTTDNIADSTIETTAKSLNTDSNSLKVILFLRFNKNSELWGNGIL